MMKKRDYPRDVAGLIRVIQEMMKVSARPWKGRSLAKILPILSTLRNSQSSCLLKKGDCKVWDRNYPNISGRIDRASPGWSQEPVIPSRSNLFVIVEHLEMQFDRSTYNLSPFSVCGSIQPLQNSTRISLTSLPALTFLPQNQGSFLLKIIFEKTQIAAIPCCTNYLKHTVNHIESIASKWPKTGKVLSWSTWMTIAITHNAMSQCYNSI